ncbi:gephyrin-like molybdotransferase Glp [Chloroflexota bacterium]
MITVDQALERILERIQVLEKEECPILSCLGQVLAEDVYSGINIPPLDNSAMDGYAVRAEDTRGASKKSPRLLRVIDTVMAGSISHHRLGPGTAIRIMTGAPVPAGADAVVRFEDTDEAQRRQAADKSTLAEVGILVGVPVGRDVRRAGEDVVKGTVVLAGGMVIRPSEVGVLASLGRDTVKVIRRPVVAILVTGNELVDINQQLTPGKIYNSNGYSLAAMVLRYGGIPRVLGVAPDSDELMAASFRRGLEADLLITTGGVSVGDYDIVKSTLAKEGEVNFWRVRMKPGRPLIFGTISGIGEGSIARSVPHLGLPGNPVSMMVTFELFARPALLKMMGRKDLSRPVIEAVLEDPIQNNDQRRIFSRAVVCEREHQYFARLTGPQGSGILTSMTLANGLVIVPEDRERVEPGEKVQVIMLDWNQPI